MIAPEIENYLSNTTYPLRIGVNTSNGPLVVSLWYLYRNGSLWCATKNDASVVRHIRQSPAVGFEIGKNTPPYSGVRGQAKAVLHDASRGKPILLDLLQRYLGGTSSKLAQKLINDADREVAIEIKPDWFKFWDYTKRMDDIEKGT